MKSVGRQNFLNEEFRRQADLIDGQMAELSQKQRDTEEKYKWAEEASRSNKEDMKQIIWFSHLKELTQEVVDIFIKRITLYRDKRMEIEWNFVGAYTGRGESERYEKAGADDGYFEVKRIKH